MTPGPPGPGAPWGTAASPVSGVLMWSCPGALLPVSVCPFQSCGSGWCGAGTGRAGTGRVARVHCAEQLRRPPRGCCQSPGPALSPVVTGPFSLSRVLHLGPCPTHQVCDRGRLAPSVPLASLRLPCAVPWSSRRVAVTRYVSTRPCTPAAAGPGLSPAWCAGERSGVRPLTGGLCGLSPRLVSPGVRELRCSVRVKWGLSVWFMCRFPAAEDVEHLFMC